MNLSKNKSMLIPALISFFVALLLVYKYTYPISWDVYYHIHVSQLYFDEGLVFRDVLTSYPSGRTIMYPPLFHLTIAGLSKITSISIVELFRLLQPFCSFYLVGIITYSTYKLTNTSRIALTSGFMSILCFVTFNRSLITTPATIAIGLFLIASIFYYTGFNDNNLRDILISAISLGLICNLHMATALLTIGVIGLYSLIQLCRKKINYRYLSYFIVLALLIASPWWIYVYLNYPMTFNSTDTNALNIFQFAFTYYGILPTIFTLIGFYSLFKNKSEMSLFLVVCSLSLVILSQMTYLGLNTISIRILEVSAYPLIIIASIGFTYLCSRINSRKLLHVILVAFLCLSVLSAIIYTDSYTPDVLTEDDSNTTLIPMSIHEIIDPIGSTFKPSIISSRFGDTDLAHDRYEVLEWFVNNGDNSSLVVSEDSIMDTIIVSTSRMRVVYGGFTESIPETVIDPVHIIENHSTTQEIHDLNIGYLILYKDTPIPIYAQLEYENNYYKICSIKSSYR